MANDPSFGLAFDTNLLSRPTQRRLMATWMESAGMKVVIVPQVMAELCAPNTVDVSARAQRINARHRARWQDAVRTEATPYALVELDMERQEAVAEIVARFTLRCFPSLNTIDEIGRHADAKVLAQALALGVDYVLTNNMKSIDHHEVNDLVTKTMGRNFGLVVTANDALLQAHSGGEASRELLTVALASIWPDRGDMRLDDAERRLNRLAETLASRGVAMPDVAQRLVNAFDVDEDLEAVLGNARQLAVDSVALGIERRWTSDEGDALPPSTVSR